MLYGLGLESQFHQPRSFPGVKQPEHGADHPSFPSAGLTLGGSYTSTSPLCLHRYVMG